jgi:hypothetical protein
MGDEWTGIWRTTGSDGISSAQNVQTLRKRRETTEQIFFAEKQGAQETGGIQEGGKTDRADDGRTVSCPFMARMMKPLPSARPTTFYGMA